MLMMITETSGRLLEKRQETVYPMCSTGLMFAVLLDEDSHLFEFTR